MKIKTDNKINKEDLKRGEKFFERMADYVKKNNYKITISKGVQAISIALVAVLFAFSVMGAGRLTSEDMKEIESYTNDLVKYQEQANVFRFALSKIKKNPSRVEAILKSLNLWDKI